MRNLVLAANLPEVARCSLRCFSRMGRRKVAVLPLPVTAWARTSLPSRMEGMVLRWMTVGCSKPSCAQALKRGLLRKSSWKLIRSCRS